MVTLNPLSESTSIFRASRKVTISDTKPQFEPKRWLITGGCGFIGTNFVKNLVEEGGHFIRVVDNLSVGTREDLSRVCQFTEPTLNDLASGSSPPASEVELVVGDILDADLALCATMGTDVIVHLAASTGVNQSVKDPRGDCMNNVIGTLNYLEAAKHNNVRRFVFASSGAPVGECEQPIHEEIVPHPVSPYGASKLAGEAYCSAYFRTYGIDTIALRFGNVYGSHSSHKNSVVAKFIRLAINGAILEIYGDGRQTRDFIHVDDLIHAIRLAATADDIGGEIFQIATNSETSVAELVQKLIPILSDAGINEIRVVHSEPRQGDMRRNYSDASKASNILGWTAQINLSEGLKATVEWFLEHTD
jgi:UDP-glucose 4-epimerase